MNTVEYKTTLDIFQDVFGGKWKLFIVAQLREGATRPSVLKQRLPGISQRMLTKDLKELVEDGIVSREIFPEVPPRVEYSLTAYGQTVMPIIDMLCGWGQAHVDRMVTNGNSRFIMTDSLDILQQEDQHIFKRALRIEP
ncbi:winged helix-turn-helix transcriptional regulator [Candidatus Leptofilum sp.]|uniref:winged helix-turn-helix transcriptional regulator n=1 Tax=Candidatus Leptofilum sp. TaxID=3241576 RepID=UPI003B5AE735